jgi:hypothetical protein
LRFDGLHGLDQLAFELHQLGRLSVLVTAERLEEAECANATGGLEDEGEWVEFAQFGLSE